MKYHIKGNVLYIDEVSVSQTDWDKIAFLTKKGTFDNCDTLHINKEFANTILAIEVEEFWNKMKTVVFPNSIEVADLQSKVQYLGKNGFKTRTEFFRPEVVVFEKGLYKITRNIISGLDSVKKIVLSDGLDTIEEAAFENCKNLETVVLPSTLASIGFAAFEGCDSLKKINWSPRNGFSFSCGAFINSGINANRIEVEITPKDCDYKVFASSEIGEYIGKDKNGNYHIVGSDSDPDKFVDYMEISKVNKLYDPYFVDDEYETEFINSNTISKFKLAPKLAKCGMRFSDDYIKDLERVGMLDKFAKTADFRPFVNDIKPLLVSDKSPVGKYTVADYQCFIKLCVALGCFSPRTYISSGDKVETTLAQKACSFMSRALKTKQIQLKGLVHKLYPMNTPVVVSQKFLDFVSTKGPNNTYPNLALLYELDSEYPHMLANVASDFDNVIDYRLARDVDAKKQTSWRDALINFYVDFRYEVDDPDPRVQEAKLFCAKRNFPSEKFDRVVDIIRVQENQEIVHHILGKPLKEKNIIDEIEEIKADTSRRIKHIDKEIQKVYSKRYTYEFLDKHDIRGVDIGAECDCCCTLKTYSYGHEMCYAAMTKNNVQHLLVNNAEGRTIAKGTMYVNEKEGYIVINEFDVIDKYREWEDLSSHDGHESSKENESNKAKERAIILDTFKRGIIDFIKVYNKTHKKRIRQVNVGWEHNKFKRQLGNYKRDKNGLDVPPEYSFCDALQEQRIFYKK